MSFQTNPKSFSTNLHASRDNKKDILWNTIQPGDPYDIRRSMIARLPGAKTKFMGDNLEMICLFQAAQIQRLIDNLEDFKVKYKQVEKKQLDRHSFEIQIKELAQRADQNDSLQADNLKLKEFIKKQAVELEELRRKASDMDANLQSKYHKALKQMQLLVKDNTQFKNQSNGMKNEIMSWRGKYEALERSSARELQQLRMNLETRRKSQIDRQIRQLQDRFQNERSQLQIQVRRLKEGLSQKGRQGEDLKERINQMGQKLSQFSTLQKKNYEYENKVVLATQQIQRLNRVLRQRNGQLTQLQNNNRQFQSKMPRLQGQLRQLRKRLQVEVNEKHELERNFEVKSKQVQQMKDIGRQIAEYENRFGLIMQEKQRLDQTLKNKSAQLMEASNAIHNYQFELQSYKRKIAGLQARANQANQLNDRVFQYESRFSQMNLKIQSLQKQQQNTEGLRQQNQIQKRKIIELGAIAGRASDYQNKIEAVTKQIDRLNNIVEGKNRQIRQLQGKVGEGQNLARQFNQIRQDFKKLTGENRDLHNELRDGQQKIRVSSTQQSKMVQQLNDYKQRLNLNNRDSQEMKKKIQKLFQQNAFLGDQNKMAQQNLRLSNAQQQKIVNELNQYKQRIQDNESQNDAIKRKIQNLIQQNSHLNDEVRNAQQNLRLSANQIAKLSSQINQYKSQLNSNTQESETYKRKIQNLISQNSHLGQEMKTAQQNLRLSAGQVVKLNNQFKIVCNQNEQLKRHLKSAGDFNRKITQLQNTVALLSQQIQRLNTVIQNKNNQIGYLKNQINQMNNMGITINSLQDRIQKLINENKGLQGEVRDVQQNLRLSAQQNQKIIKQLGDYKQRISTNDQQSEALKRKIQKLLQENSGLAEEVRNAQENVRLSNAQQSKAFQQLTEYKKRIEQNDAENDGFRRKMQNLVNQNKQLGDEVRNAQENLRLSANTIAKLNSQLNEHKSRNNQESETYKQKLTKLLAENSSLGDEVRNVQENLRLSANTIAKLNNELKVTCNQLQQSKRRVQEITIILERKNQQNSKLSSQIQQMSSMGTTIQTLQERIQRLAGENKGLGDEVRDAQENLRLSAQQNQKIMKELGDYKDRISNNNLESEALKKKMQKLLQENSGLAEQVRNAQENVRLSNAQQSKAFQQLTEYKKRIEQNDAENEGFRRKMQNLVQENQQLGDEVRNAQENLRLSANTIAKLNSELNDHKARNNQQSETYKQKLAKLLAQNTSLGDEVRNVQENLRLSANTIAKLNNELKVTCNELEDAKKRIQQLENVGRRAAENESKIALLSQEIERLNGVLQKKNIDVANMSKQLQEMNSLGVTIQTLQERIQRLVGENKGLGDEVRDAQENLRLSAQQNQKIIKQLSEYKDRLSTNDQESEALKKKIQKLFQQNSGLAEQVRNAQENVRLSNAQQSKAFQQLTEYKKRIEQNDAENEGFRRKMQNLVQENQQLGDEVRNAQENLRLSANTIAKLNSELNDHKARNNQQSETYKQKLAKLLAQNTSLGDEVRNVQQNLRLSANTIAKLNNELKVTCNELEDAKKRIQQLENVGRRAAENESKIALLSQEIERLNGVLQKKNIDVANMSKQLQEMNSLGVTIQTLQERIQRLVGENKGLGDEVRDAQENLRLSAQQNQKIIKQLSEYKDRLSTNDQESEALKKKIQKLFQQNSGLAEEVRNAQENVRLSNAQQSKAFQQLTEYKKRIEQNDAENDGIKRKMQNLIQQNQQLGDEVRNAQENLRLSANTIAKLNSELNDHKARNNQQSETYKQKLAKLLAQNTSLGDEVRNVQQNLRLSANTVAKLNNELKITCNELEDAKKRIQQLGGSNKKNAVQYQTKIALLSQQLQRLNGQLQKRNQQINLNSRKIAQFEQITQTNVKQSETYKLRLNKIMNQNTSLGEQVRAAQQNLRLSANTVAKLNNQLKIVCNENQELQKRVKELTDSSRKIVQYQNKIALLSQEIERLNSVLEKKNQEVTNLRNKLHEIDSMNQTIGTLQEKITRLVNQNVGYDQDLKTAQQNLRLSANQNQKMMRELNQYKQKIQQNNQQNQIFKQKIGKLMGENTSLNEEVRTAQQNLRLSANTQARLQKQLNEYRSRIQANNQQSDTYKLKMQKLLAENSALGDEVRTAQQNLRLSAGTVAKLNNQLKITCNQNEQLKRRIDEMARVIENKTKENRFLSESSHQLENLGVQVKMLNEKLRKLTGENESLHGQVRQGQQKLRLSNNQIGKLTADIQNARQQLNRFLSENTDLKRKTVQSGDLQKKLVQYENKIALLSQQIQRLTQMLDKKTQQNNNLNRKLHQIDEMNKSIGSLQDKISRLVNENTSIQDEMRNAQQNLRLSANQNQKMQRQITQYKRKIQQNTQQNQTLKNKINKLVAENSSLNQDFQGAQQSLRLSANAQAKLNKQLAQIRNQIAANSQQNQTYKQKIKMLTSENVNLNDQVRTAQDNLRLSANQLAKIKNQLKVVCGQNEQLKRRVLESGGANKKVVIQLQEKVVLLSAQVQRLRSLTSTNQSIHESSKQKLLDYETKLTRLTQEFEKLNGIIQELRRQNQALKQQNYELESHVGQITSQFSEQKIQILNSQIDRLTKLVQEKEEDLSQLKLRFSDEASLVKRIQQHLSLFVVLFAEIESLRKRVKDKERQVEDVRRSSLAPFRKIE